MERLRRLPRTDESVELIALDLAGRHSISLQPGRERPLGREIRRRLKRLDRELGAVYRILQSDPQAAEARPRVVEWLLDNEYLIRDTLRMVGVGLPPAYYGRLPRLAVSAEPNLPRVLDLARVAVAESRLQVDPDQLLHLVSRYQDERPLTIGELWAVPAALRLALLEVVSRTAATVFGVVGGPSGTRGAARARLPRSPGDDLTTIAAGIGSLRTISSHDWRRFVERASVVERVLRGDPPRVYGRMDLDSRDRCRRAVEDLARGSALQEEEVAREVVKWSRASRTGPEGRESHVGYWLIGEGRPALERRLRYRAPAREAVRRFVLRHPRLAYGGVAGAITFGLLLGPGQAAIRSGEPGSLVVALLILGLVPASSLALSVANRLVTATVPPRVLAKLDPSVGVPEDCRTVVAIPVLVNDTREVDALLASLDVRYQGNADPNIWWALLTDWADAPEQQMPTDEAILQRAAEGVEQLNARYGDGGHVPFLLLHRRREWNASEGCWMGWERKRGKLHELNQLLLEAEGTRLVPVVGDVRQLTGIRYVITLDSDTHLPPGAAAGMVATMAHPLNRPRFGPDGRVRAGYTVLQPGLETALEWGETTAFTRIMDADTGLDLYSHAVSDVYQDLFGEGIYAGKGIIDVVAFQRCVDGRVPDNALLSHDLFEGVHGRAGLVSDVQLFEESPHDVVAYARRLHRWIRGDWQLLPWLAPTVPARGGGRVASSLSALDRWKILDNLRRSLLAPSLLSLVLVGWTLGLGPAWAWTLVPVLVLSVPSFLDAASVTRRLLGHPRARRSGSVRESVNVQASGRLWLSGLGRAALTLIFLPYLALLSADAIVRTLLRLLITRRHLLEWTTAAHASRKTGSRSTRSDVWRALAAVPPLAAAALVAVFFANPGGLGGAAVLAVPWLASPTIARATGRRRPQDRATELDADDRRLLRDVALRTWLYFERHLTSEDHWLPPDNYQEGRAGAVARRTSPTNIGVFLTATLSAWDLGYIGPLELEALVLNTLESMRRLERHRGHLLNWYETEDLQPLHPRYVSTVDSGNLAAALITLRHGLEEGIRTPMFRPALLEGLADTVRSATRLLASLGGTEVRRPAVGLRRNLAELSSGLARGSRNLLECHAYLQDMEDRYLAETDELVVELAGTTTAHVRFSALRDLRVWTRKLHQHVGLLRRLCRTCHPWLAVLAETPPPLREAASGSGLETRLRELEACLAAPVSPEDVPAMVSRARARARALLDEAGSELSSLELEAARAWGARLDEALGRAVEAARRLVRSLADAAREADRLVQEMDFGFLFDRRRGLFHIGFDVSADELDPNYYDLLASEARLASFVAIAKGDVPREHWLRLGRPYTRLGGRPVLLSWAATIFEYLLPQLYLRTPPHTLLGRSCRDAVQRQIRFARRRRIPWGISESGYHQLGSDASYQYRAFGVPELGLRRDPGERVVISPYASLLALSLDTPQVVRNLRRLIRLDMLGPMGLYEAIDYGPPARIKLTRPKRVRSYMAHHQGMILVAIGNRLASRRMADRFHVDARIAANEYLLNERMAWSVPVRQTWTATVRTAPRKLPTPPAVTPWTVSPASPLPETHILSNGSYTVRLTGRGGGASYWKGTALTRWSADPVVDDAGTWMYARDLVSGHLWSAAPAPAGHDGMSVELAPHQAEFRDHRHGIGLRMRITVPPDDDLEIRLVTVSNEGRERRRLALVSYAEVVLAQEAAYRRHPAYSKLFVQTRWLPGHDALLLWRRPQTPEATPVWLAHSVVCSGGSEPPVLSFETDRARFVGRGGTCSRPAALDTGLGVLSDTTGFPLDPIFSLSCRFELAPREIRQFAFLTAAAATRQAVRETLDFYRSFLHVSSASELARQRTQLNLQDLRIQPHEMEEFQAILSSVLRSHHGLRPGPEALAGWTRPQPALWKHGISGDHPIVLLRIAGSDEVGRAGSLLRAHRYWRFCGTPVDLVILDLESGGYARPLRDRLAAAIEEEGGAEWVGRPGGIHVVGVEACDAEDRALLEGVARVVLDGGAGDVLDLVREIRRSPALLPAFVPGSSSPPGRSENVPIRLSSDLVLFNGIGGFSPDGREYVIRVRRDRPTPAPWINVLANRSLGCLVSESSLGCTWSKSASENRLTPWRNDPVSDSPAESIYLRDEETAEVWSPTPLPCGTAAPYEVRHGAGYTSFRHHSHGLRHLMTVFCAPDAPVKIVRLRLENARRRPRRITATYYAEWVLGRDRDASAHYVIPEYDPAAQALLVRNPFARPFAGRVAFVAASEPPHSLTADRFEFLGRSGDPARPAALERIGFSGTVRAGLDPCAAWMVHLDLAPGETKEVHFVIGQEENREAAVARAMEYRPASAADDAWERLTVFWDRTLGAVTVDTPDPAMNLALNRWLLYQTLSCRMWARTALYQSSGAFGYRDQLQDCLALLEAAPEVARAHILEAAGRQFEEGDVLHWWLPDTTAGVRTRCSDDLLWLPYVTSEYVRHTGDTGVLDEPVPYLRGPPLERREAERYDRYEITDGTESLYEHCARAIERGTTAGPHGLPLIGSGDWNDGMNRIGLSGRGESVWLAWFLTAVARRFAGVAAGRGDALRARQFRELAETLPRRVDEVAWDGEWYLRAFHDDGTPLGSAEAREARIDAISQAWSVLAGGGDPERAALAMRSVDRLLVQDEDRLVLLLAPPFDRAEPDPGYIRGYPPGVRENGGQYTHAAAWVAWAFTALGDGESAIRLFEYLNPIRSSATPAGTVRYAVEPYVAAADVYGVPPFTGRGGWTWYTGSAAWLYRLGTEAILGLVREGDVLCIQPCLPAAWEGFRAELRHGSATYRVRVENTKPAGDAESRCGVRKVILDGVEIHAQEQVETAAHRAGPAARVPLLDDGRPHEVLICL
jgi:cyclic beta-1,2-glucan synthetase